MKEVFKYDIQELSKYGENELFLNKNSILRVFKICTTYEYEKLTKVIKDNSIKI